MKTLEELRARVSEVVERMKEIDSEHGGKMLSAEAASEWKDLKAEREQLVETIDELEIRSQVIREAAEQPEERTETGASFHVGVKRGERDIYDMSSIRSESRDEDHFIDLMRDNALRSVESSRFVPPRNSGQNAEDVQSHVNMLLDNDPVGEIARRVLTTGSTKYRRAFTKAIAGDTLSGDEMRTLSTTGNKGGYAVPYALDPTIIHVSDSSVNPYRAISDVRTITGSNTWQGVTSPAITASRVAESGTATAGDPTLSQPSGTVTRVHAFVPFSYEIGGDIANLQGEITSLFMEAKDDEEATAFTTGSGTAPNPVGILGAQGLGTAAPPKVLTAGTAALVVGDIDTAQLTLAPRWRARAVWVANLYFYQKVRRFYTAGGETLLANNQQGFSTNAPTPGNIGYGLLGRPAYECTAINTTNVLTTGTKLAVFGDFGRGFTIVDRVGMNVEVIPNLMGASGYPMGQRGLYAWWRNTSVLTAGSAFVYLQTL